MSLPLYNSVQTPTHTLLLKWARKGKSFAPSETTLRDDFSSYAISIIGFNGKCTSRIAFISRKGKALVSFENAEIAQRAFDQCESGEIKCNNAAQYHPSYCELVKQQETDEDEDATEEEVVRIRTLPD